MLTKMRNFLPTMQKQIHTQKIPGVPLLTAGEQTKLTWAKIIKSYETVPEAYQDFFAPFWADGQAFPYTVFTPSREGFLSETPEKLICDFEDEIHVLERSEKKVDAQCYPIEGVNYVEVKSVLLDSHIKISGVTKQGIPASSTIKFNSVGDYLFTPILKRIRHVTVDAGNVAQNSEIKKFDHLIRLNYKFMNYAKHSILVGDRVIHFILQPEIQLSMLKIFDWTYYKTISPTHMCILTGQELITIRETEPESKTIGKYGGTWNYIPLNKIMSLSLERKDNDLLALSIQLSESIRFEFLFQSSAKQDLDQLLEHLSKLTTKQ